MTHKTKHQKLKLLIIVKSIDGGTGTFLENLYASLNKSAEVSSDILIICLERPTFRKTKLTKIKYLHRKNFYPQKYSLLPSNFFNFFRELAIINKLSDDFSPYIIMGMDLRCNLLTILHKVLFQKNVKVIASTHLNLSSMTLDISNKPIRFLLKRMVKILYQKTDGLICVSKLLAFQLKHDFNIQHKIDTIYNGIATRVSKPKKLTNHKRIILSVGRLNKQKDYETLIKAATQAINVHDNYEFWISGDGPEKQKLQKLINDSGMGNKIKLLGWSNNIKKIYQSADIFVLSSKAEGFGYVLIEAMANGLPIIATNAKYGPSEVLEKGKYGILVPVGDYTSMSNSILKMTSDSRTYSRYSRLSIERSGFFSTKKMTQEYIGVFRRIIGK